MIDSLEQLVHALRDELQEYGEMLARLDEQQELVIRREAAAVLERVPSVQEQTSALTAARETRFAAMKKVCAAVDLAVDSTFETILPRCPDNYRLLIGALVQENNSLLQRVHQRARQNHLLLMRTVESMQRVIHSLANHRTVPVYNGTGGIFAAAPAAPALYEAVG
jgi:flagellar biosynthesis/type III secretory pathway chaperone